MPDISKIKIADVEYNIKDTTARENTGGSVALDTTLTKAGQAADAKAVGDKFSELSEEIGNLGGGTGAGAPGPAGADGVGIQSVEQTTTSTVDGGTNVITVTKTDGTSSTFAVRNGSRGSSGPAGADGQPGADGKSAYQYAQDGGYTGTEAEFAAKLAQEIHPGAYPVVDMTDSTAELSPNTFYRWGEIAALSVTLSTPSDTTITNEYCFEFVSGETATTLTVPDTIAWAQEPVIEAGKTYQVSILHGVGVICGA